MAARQNYQVGPDRWRWRNAKLALETQIAKQSPEWTTHDEGEAPRTFKAELKFSQSFRFNGSFM